MLPIRKLFPISVLLIGAICCAQTQATPDSSKSVDEKAEVETKQSKQLEEKLRLEERGLLPENGEKVSGQGDMGAKLGEHSSDKKQQKEQAEAEGSVETGETGTGVGGVNQDLGQRQGGEERTAGVGGSGGHGQQQKGSDQVGIGGARAGENIEEEGESSVGAVGDKMGEEQVQNGEVGRRDKSGESARKGGAHQIGKEMEPNGGAETWNKSGIVETETEDRGKPAEGGEAASEGTTESNEVGELDEDLNFDEEGAETLAENGESVDGANTGEPEVQNASREEEEEQLGEMPESAGAAEEWERGGGEGRSVKSGRIQNTMGWEKMPAAEEAATILDRKGSTQREEEYVEDEEEMAGTPEFGEEQEPPKGSRGVWKKVSPVEEEQSAEGLGEWEPPEQLVDGAEGEMVREPNKAKAVLGGGWKRISTTTEGIGRPGGTESFPAEENGERHADDEAEGEGEWPCAKKAHLKGGTEGEKGNGFGRRGPEEYGNRVQSGWRNNLGRGGWRKAGENHRMEQEDGKGHGTNANGNKSVGRINIGAQLGPMARTQIPAQGFKMVKEAKSDEQTGAESVGLQAEGRRGETQGGWEEQSEVDEEADERAPEGRDADGDGMGTRHSPHQEGASKGGSERQSPTDKGHRHKEVSGRRKKGKERALNGALEFSKGAGWRGLRSKREDWHCVKLRALCMRYRDGFDAVEAYLGYWLFKREHREGESPFDGRPNGVDGTRQFRLLAVKPKFVYRKGGKPMIKTIHDVMESIVEAYNGYFGAGAKRRKVPPELGFKNWRKWKLVRDKVERYKAESVKRHQSRPKLERMEEELAQYGRHLWEDPYFSGAIPKRRQHLLVIKP